MSNPSYSPGYLAPPGYNTTVQPDDPASRSPSTTSQQTLASNAPTAQPVTSVESGSNVNLKETEDTEDTERRREQNRINQRNHKRRKIKELDNLRTKCAQLKIERDKLEATNIQKDNIIYTLLANRSNGESATQTDTAVGGTVHRGTQTDSDGIVYTGHVGIKRTAEYAVPVKSLLVVRMADPRQRVERRIWQRDSCQDWVTRVVTVVMPLGRGTT
ncbi:uncharacterized protein L203_105247 [Cryptococcus depauperatus CBS 7841]|uniref:BZIP domain-containing protein n=1 Tax=Cryptococcus depauperatus CBS 7841 TaxID=1295531 RepID=A0AAJ8M2X7_9TREE